MDIKRIVKKLTEDYNTKDPFKLAKKLDISIRYYILEDTKGFYKKILTKKYIFINSELSEFEQRVVCAHELGHAILHSSKKFEFMLDRTSLIRKSRVEEEANLFASWLLFNDDIDDEYYSKKNIEDWVIDNIINLKNKWGN